MEVQILENIESLYRSHIVTLACYIFLIAATLFITIAEIKIKGFDAKWKNVALVSIVALGSAVLLVSQFFEIYPVYKDYSERSYVVVEDVKVIIKGDSSGVFDKINSVVIYENEKKTELKMQTDIDLDTEREYTGKIAYLKHSNYIVWYNFE